jgi:chromosome segregation ATPase
MNKFSVEDQYKIVALCRNWVYKSKNNKDYAKNTIQKDKSIIKDKLTKRELDWSNIKDVLYYIHMNLDPEKQQSIGVLKLKITTLEKKNELQKQVYDNERINMRDIIKKEYEKTFEDKYAVGQVADLEKELNRFKVECMKLRTSGDPVIAKLRIAEEEYKEKIIALEEELAKNGGTQQKINDITKGKIEKEIQKSCNNCKILTKKYKKLKTERRELTRKNNQLEQKIQKLEDKLDDIETGQDSNIEMSISDIDSDSTDSS